MSRSSSAVTADVLRVDGLTKSFWSGHGVHTEVTRDLSFSVRKGEFLVILGPSGCGKTTLLRCISGLLRPDAGAVTHNGRPVTGVPPWVGIVFQEYNKSLFPWLTVERNVALAVRDLPRDQARERAATSLERVGLAAFGRHYPWELSGGMQQRAVIARALAPAPELLVMDEPFASVDALTRIKLEDMLLELWSRLGFTAVFVTHDIEEALYLADRVLVLSNRPSTVKAELTVDLPRPRDQLTTKALPGFQALRSRAFDLIESAADRPHHPGRGGSERSTS